MNTKMTTLAAAVLMTASPLAISTAAAEVTFSGNVALTTDYVYRGISQTDEGAAIQGGFDLEHDSGFYAGVWASNLDFGDDADIEIDYYAGFGGEFSNKVGYDLGVLYYSYPDSDAADAGDYDFTEVYGSLSYDFGPAAVTGGLAYSGDFFGSTGDSLYATVDVDVPLPNDFALGLHYGNQDIDDVDDYNEWNIGLSKSLSGFDFALTYHDTDIDENDANAAATEKLSDDRFVFTISKSL